MLNETLDSPGGEIAVKKKAKKPSRADRIAAWRKENRAAYTVAYRACCTCAPTRAQALLVDQFLGNVPVPID